jgi:hypothetical protein
MVQAQKIMGKIKAWESDKVSVIFQDKQGNTLVGYFARQLEANVKVSLFTLPGG